MKRVTAALLLPLLLLVAPAGVVAIEEDDGEGPVGSPSSAGTWTKKAPSGPPSARSRHFMVYDPPTKKIVLFGGTSGGGETWAYDTAADSWTNKNPSPAPGARNAHAMGYDSKRNLVFLYGGTSGGAETWVYDATANTWSNKNPTGSPPARTDAKVVYEPNTDRFILFGGKTSSGRTDDMYAYSPANNSWTPIPLTTKPSPRHRHAMTLDPVARKVVLHGGCIEDNCASQFSDETWVLDPMAGGWTKVNPSPNAGARDDHTLIWDAKDSRLVTCCGYVGGSGYNADVWEFDTGTTKWTQATVGSTKPSGRYSYDWAWDAGQGVAVLFGGQTSSGASGETWVYDPGGGGGGAPAVVGTDPASGATGVPVSSEIAITFSMAMDKTATEGAISASPSITGTFNWSAGDTKVNWRPAAALQPQTQYTVTVSTAAKSAQGAALPAAHSWSFTTAGGGGAPKVVSTSPADSATNVPLSANIDMTFDMPMSKTETESAVSASPAISGSFAWSGGDTRLSWDPATDLLSSTAYTVTVSTAAKSAAGVNLAAPFALKFTTGTKGDATPPSITHAPLTRVSEGTPVDVSATVQDDTGISLAKLYYRKSGATSYSSISMGKQAGDDYKGTIPASEVVPPAVEYYIEAIDLASKSATHPAAGGAAPHTVTVDPKGAPAPRVASTDPADGATNVAVSASITITFDVEMDRAATEGSVSTSPSTSVGFSWDPAGTKLTADPGADLEPGKKYTVTVGTGAKSKAGVAIAAAHAFSFTTSSAGGGGGSQGGSAGGLFGMGPTADLAIVGILVAILVVAAVAFAMRRRRRPGVPVHGGTPQGQWPPPYAQDPWQQPPAGGQGGFSDGYR